MTTEDIVRAIVAVAESLDLAIGTSKWYVFGSALSNPTRAADIDLMVVCSDVAIAAEVKRCLHDVTFERPLDLSILTAEEEAELHFVSNQGCKRIFP